MNKSILIAIVIAVAAGGWIASGQFANGAREEPDEPAAQAEAEAIDRLQSVRIIESTARQRQNRIVVSGRTMPSREVTLRAETAGRLDEVYAIRGDVVTDQQVLARLSIDERTSRLAEAQAVLRQREIEYTAAESLEQKGFRSETSLAEARAQLDGARYAVDQINIDIENTQIRAPFDGVLTEGHVELGDYLGIGDEAGQIIDLDPIIVVGYATELEVANLEVGAMGRARVLSGQDVDGVISFVAPAADPSARTFRFELEVPNPDYRIRAGLTSEIVVATDAGDAHLIPSSILTLADDGTIGIKVLNDDDIVEFVPITIVEDSGAGLWVEGLPDTVDIITVGQDFVIPGQRVRPVLAEASGAAAS